MGTFTIDGRAEGIRSVTRGVKEAVNAIFNGDRVQQQAYIDTMGKTKQAEEARALKMTNDYRQSVDQMIADEPNMPEYKKSLLTAWKLLGGEHVDNFSRAGESEQRIAHREAVMKNPALALPTAQAHFATSGKAPFDNVGNTGHSVNQATGEQIVANPVIAKLFQSKPAATGRQGGGLSLTQQRSNAEIDAARETVGGMTPEEIRRRTAKTTDTGRENMDYDPTLARASTLAGRRKIGTDAFFDNRNQGAPAPAPVQGADQDIIKRFTADPAMKQYRIGKATPQGIEVLDSAGRVIGHYR